MPGRTWSTAPRGYVRAPDDVPAFWQLGYLWRLMASGHQTGNALSFIDQLVTGSGGGPASHLHPSDEGLYVASGQCTFDAGGERLCAGVGSLVVVPRFTEHAFTVDVPGTHLLNFYVPAGVELFLVLFAHPAERNELPPENGVSPPPARLVDQLSRDYGHIQGIGGRPGVDKPTPERMVTRPNPDAVVPPYMATAAASPRWWHDGQLWSVLADQARTDGSFSMFEILAPRGTGAPPHLFVEADACYYILDGTMDMLVGHEVRAAATGDFVFVPKETPHARRTASETARLLHLRTPAGFERVLRAFGQQTDATEPPPPNWSGREVSPERVQHLLDDLGCRLVAMPDPFAR